VADKAELIASGAKQIKSILRRLINKLGGSASPSSQSSLF